MDNFNSVVANVGDSDTPFGCSCKLQCICGNKVEATFDEKPLNVIEKVCNKCGRRHHVVWQYIVPTYASKTRIVIDAWFDEKVVLDESTLLSLG